jgi:hypothetical protein
VCAPSLVRSIKLYTFLELFPFQDDKRGLLVPFAVVFCKDLQSFFIPANRDQPTR